MAVGTNLMVQRLTLGSAAQVDVTNLLTVTGQTVVTGTNSLRLVGGSMLGDLTLTQGDRLDLTGAVSFASVTISNGAMATLAGAVNANSMMIGSNGVLTAPRLVALDLTVNGALTVASNGVVDASNKGYPAGQGDNSVRVALQGPGGGWNTAGSCGWNGGGGSYGGLGPAPGGESGGSFGAAYGSFTQPSDFGSGGGTEN